MHAGHGGIGCMHSSWWIPGQRTCHLAGHGLQLLTTGQLSAALLPQMGAVLAALNVQVHLQTLQLLVVLTVALLLLVVMPLTLCCLPRGHCHRF